LNWYYLKLAQNILETLNLHQHGCENLKSHAYMNILYKQEKCYISWNGEQKHPDYFALEPQSNVADVAVTLVWLPQLFLKSRTLIWMWNLQQMPIVNIQFYLKEHGPSVQAGCWWDQHSTKYRLEWEHAEYVIN
jgi:hypothetical protein